ncbi:MAG TPA: OmpH family outer membrane protein [Chthoniobacteraceae bacterium]|nr:OmpH family outer membrane protein [Chthoniobacteraceae bacterium]
MKKLIVLSCALACLVFAAGTASAQNLKIGTVDMEKIFKNYYKTKDAEVRINEARTTAKKELDDRVEQYKETMDEIKRLNDELQNPGLSDSKRDDITKTREEKINEFHNLDREIQEFRAQREKDLQDDAIRMRNDIVTDIMKLVNAKIQSENYDFVFDRSGPSLNGVPVMIYARAAVDFSDDIITQLNKNKPKDTSTPAPSHSPAAPGSTSPGPP